MKRAIHRFRSIKGTRIFTIHRASLVHLNDMICPCSRSLLLLNVAHCVPCLCVHVYVLLVLCVQAIKREVHLVKYKSLLRLMNNVTFLALCTQSINVILTNANGEPYPVNTCSRQGAWAKCPIGNQCAEISYWLLIVFCNRLPIGLLFWKIQICSHLE